MGKKKFLEKLVFVKWKDSYGVDTGWKDISEYSASLLEIKSLGKVIYEDKEIISLAQNFSDEFTHIYIQVWKNFVTFVPREL